MLLRGPGVNGWGHAEPADTVWHLSGADGSPTTNGTKPANLTGKGSTPPELVSPAAPQLEETPRYVLEVIPGMVNEHPLEPAMGNDPNSEQQHAVVSRRSSQSTGITIASSVSSGHHWPPGVACDRGDLARSGSIDSELKTPVQRSGSLLVPGASLLPGSKAPSQSPSLGEHVVTSLAPDRPTSRMSVNGRLSSDAQGEGSRRPSFNLAYQQQQKTQMEEVLKTIENVEKAEKKNKKNRRHVFTTEQSETLQNVMDGIRDAWVNSAKANLIFGAVIAANAVFIGAEADARRG